MRMRLFLKIRNVSGGNFLTKLTLSVFILYIILYIKYNRFNCCNENISMRYAKHYLLELITF